jgi:hypothetical protein
VLPSAVRILLGAAGLLLAGFGAAALALGWAGGLQALVGGIVVLVGVLFERARYKRLETAPPPPPFEATAERFVDPGSGAPVTVYANPLTGERRYVRD